MISGSRSCLARAFPSEAHGTDQAGSPEELLRSLHLIWDRGVMGLDRVGGAVVARALTPDLLDGVL